MKARNAGILSAILGSICCVGPLILVALGLGTGAAVIGRYHWIFIAAAIAVLCWAWFKHLREAKHCACEHRVMDGRWISLVILLFASALVLGLTALNASSYIFTGPTPPLATGANANIRRVVIPVKGMTCATCEIAVRNALKRVDGVAAAHASVASETATIDYDPARTNPEQLVSAINSTGYHASPPRK